MNQTLGNRIAETRRAKSMTQEELAERLGISAQAVSKWENDVSCPDISLLPTLARELGLTLDELLTGKQPAPVTLPPRRGAQAARPDAAPHPRAFRERRHGEGQSPPAAGQGGD